MIQLCKIITRLTLISFISLPIIAQKNEDYEIEVSKLRDVFDIFLGDSLFKYFDLNTKFDTLNIENFTNGEGLKVIKQNLTENYYRITSFLSSGAKYRETFRTKDTRYGYDIIWNSNGNLNWIGCFGLDCGYVNQIEWFDSDAIKEISLEDKTENKGLIIRFFPSGMQKEYIESIPFTDQGCKVSGFYENGQLAYTGIFNMGKQLYTAYYESGKKAKEGYIFNLDLLKVGIWKEWDENGNLIKTQNYPSEQDYTSE